MPPPKKDKGSAHIARAAGKAVDRLRDAARDAQKGSYNIARLTQDVSNASVDVLNVFAHFLDLGASPNVGVVDYGSAPGNQDWKQGLVSTVQVVDQIPDTVTFPASWPATITMTKVDGTGSITMQVLGVDSQDDGFQLRVQIKSNANVAAGEYFGNLYYTDAAGTKVFATMVRGIAT